MYEDGIDGDFLKEVVANAIKKIDIGAAVLPNPLFRPDIDEHIICGGVNDSSDDDDDDDDAADDDEQDVWQDDDLLDDGKEEIVFLMILKRPPKLNRPTSPVRDELPKDTPLLLKYQLDMPERSETNLMLSLLNII